MTPSDIADLQANYMVPVYAPDKLLVKGQGCRVWDGDGQEYLDFTSGIAVCNLGHCHPVVTEAIQRQAAKLVHVSNLFMNEVQPQLAAKIAAHSFDGLVFFANSGAEANEGLIKFARKYGHEKGRHEIICMEGSFHGRTLATLAATSKPKYRQGFAPDMEGFTFVPFNDVDALRAAINERTVAIMMEPVQGEGGVRPASQAFIGTARELCDEHELLLLFDEVQVGAGRLGRMFGHQIYGIEPDAMSMAKGLGNGFPIGAFEIQRKHRDVLGVGNHASTFGGTPLACAAALAVFQVLEQEDVLLNCQKMGQHLKGAFIHLAGKYDVIKEVRGEGLLLGIECHEPVGEAVKAAAKQGLLILSAGENVFRFAPPLIVNQTEIDQAVEIFDAVLGEMS